MQLQGQESLFGLLDLGLGSLVHIPVCNCFLLTALFSIEVTTCEIQIITLFLLSNLLEVLSSL